MAYKLPCSDILQFQETLKQMRDLDDKIIYALNMSLPTESMKARTTTTPEGNCRELYEELKKGYHSRAAVINDCILVTSNQVSDLKEKRESGIGGGVEKQFKSETRKLRILHQEQAVEDIVKEKTLKSFNERCRKFYRADNF